MHKVFCDFLHCFVLIFFDYIIYLLNLQEHQQHVVRLWSFHLFFNAEKFQLHQSEIQFLGYIVNEYGIAIDDGKMESITTWPIPHTVKELQRFLCFTSFYHWVNNNYCLLVNPLTSLLCGKPKSLSWSSDAEEDFQTLKPAFCSAPLLTHPNPELPFIIEVDGSRTSVGAIQFRQLGNPLKLHPCAYLCNLTLGTVNFSP